MGRKQDIPPEIEASLVYHIFLMELRGFALTISEAGKTWFYAFKKRDPNLSVRKPDALSLARARGMNKADVTKFFEMFENC
ncbi:hypothetical protein PR048_005014 [Dryococelus australis]|uniref:Transposase n=1 Tax=Dryococelus australis TaxID=614101 RepID=A0ABQ9I825_9NEOP|nr:hypothetical protein PR048_005014 [Dryococelus australis]